MRGAAPVRRRRAGPGRTHGRHPASRPPDPLAALSVREREVAELAAAGLSSRQVAERLVLSTRTIDTHLGNAYRKLGVSSRVALTRLLGPPPGGLGTPVA